MIIFENANYRINNEWGSTPYSDETNFIEVTRKVSTVKGIGINYGKYTFYSNTLQVDVSDYIRAYGSGIIYFQDYDNNLLYPHSFSSKKAFKPLVTEIMPPSILPFNDYGLYSAFLFYFYLPQYKGCDIMQFIWGSWAFPNTVSDVPQNYSVLKGATQIKITGGNSGVKSPFDRTFDRTFRGIGLPTVVETIYFDLQKPPCGSEWYCLEWAAENHLYKSFFFQLNSTIRSSDNSIEIADKDNADGYNVIKNKKFGFNLGLERADLLTRRYIADLFYSDNVLLHFLGKRERVFIDSKEFSIVESEIYQDVNFNVMIKKFDTI